MYVASRQNPLDERMNECMDRCMDGWMDKCSQ